MKNIRKIIILILATTILLSAQTWNHILSDYSIIDIEVYNGGYWVATESDGAFRYDSQNNQWFRYNQDNGIMSENDNINDMKIMGGKVWFATNYGIYTCSLSGSNWKHTLLPPGDYFSNWVRAFDANSDKVYIAGFTGLYTYSFATNSYTEYGNLKPDYSQTSYTNSIFATDSIVWIGTDDGVFRYDTSLPISNDSSITYYSKSNGIPTTSDLVMCRSLYANEQGLWMGLDEYTTTQSPNYCLGGLFSFDGNNWDKFDESTGLPADGIHFIQEYDNKIYAGLFHYVDGVNFDGAGLLVMDMLDTTWQVLNASNWHIENDSVRSFYCTETDTLVGTDHGLFTNLDDLPDLAPFNAPGWFSVRSIGNMELEVTVDPVYLAERYMLFADNLDGDTTSCPIYGTRDTIQLHNESYTYRVTICAANEWGRGPLCKDVLTVSTGDEKNAILIIQGFDKEIAGSIDNLCLDHSLPIVEAGFGIDAVSDEALTETDININDYEMVDWILGIENNIMPVENKQLIRSFLESGGKLLITGSQIIESVSGVNIDVTFYNEYLKAKWKKSGVKTYDVEAISPGIFNGIGNFSFDDGSLIVDVERPDGFQPLNGAESCLLYTGKDSSSYGSAALQYTGTFGGSTEEAQLVYMGFPLESVTLDSTRNAIMLCVLDYFNFDVTLTDVSDALIPKTLELKQNYPNPFNPNTLINYQLSAVSPVELSVYDINGKKVETLIKGIVDAGQHAVEFYANDLPSGVYFCRLIAGNEIQTIKMLLMK